MNEKATSQRNYGIDLLRIVSMLLIALLHCLGCGGILSGSSGLPVNYQAARLMEILSYCAVDCFALISGYVGYGRKIRFSNLICLMIQVTFYDVLITGLFMAFTPVNPGYRGLIVSFLSVFWGRYWYITAYFAMFFFLPFLNRALELVSQDVGRKIIWAIVFVMCIVPTLFRGDPANTIGGYSMIWLMSLYFIGGYLKKFDCFCHTGSLRLLGGYFGCCLFIWIVQNAVEMVTVRIFGEPKLAYFLLNLVSPPVVCCSVCLLILFSRLHLNAGMVHLVKFFAPAALGVYLIHTHPLIYEYVLRDFLLPLSRKPVLVMSGAVCLAAAGIWLVCSLADLIRLKLFTLIRIPRLAAAAEEAGRRIFSRLCSIGQK